MILLLVVWCFTFWPLLQVSFLCLLTLYLKKKKKKAKKVKDEKDGIFLSCYME